MNKLEENIIAAGADIAPRITPEHIAKTIKGIDFINAGDATGNLELSLLTICVLTLENGFTVTGESACASPENFNADIGRSIALENAKEKIWLLEGYLLKQRLYEEAQKDALVVGLQDDDDCAGCKI